MVMTELLCKFYGPDNEITCFKNNDTGDIKCPIKYWDAGGSRRFYTVEYAVDKRMIHYDLSSQSFKAIFDIEVWKLNSDLHYQWGYHKTYNQAYGVAIDGSDNICIVGYENNYKSLWKLNSSRIFQWNYDTGGACFSIAIDSSDYIYITGQRAGNKSVWKLNSAGVFQWDYDTGDQGNKIIEKSGYVYIAGNRNAINLKSVWKLNSAGVFQWDYDTGDRTQNLIVDDSGNVYIVGYRSGNKTIWKLNSSGVLQWSYDTGSTIAWDIALDSNGNVYVVGDISSSKNLWKLNSSGVLQDSWLIIIAPITIVIDSLDNLYIGGGTEPLLGNHTTIRKADVNNIFMQEFTMNEMGNNLRDLYLDSNDNLYITVPGI